jgi:hypothetical protein
MKNVEIPKKEKRTKRLFIPLTPTEHSRISHYCTEKQITFSDLIRFSLKETIDF